MTSLLTTNLDGVPLVLPRKLPLPASRTFASAATPPGRAIDDTTRLAGTGVDGGLVATAARLLRFSPTPLPLSRLLAPLTPAGGTFS